MNQSAIIIEVQETRDSVHVHCYGADGERWALYSFVNLSHALSHLAPMFVYCAAPIHVRLT